jgi:hypothetical protein
MQTPVGAEAAATVLMMWLIPAELSSSYTGAVLVTCSPNLLTSRQAKGLLVVHHGDVHLTVQC